MDRFRIALTGAIAMLGLAAGAMPFAEAVKSTGKAIAEPKVMTQTMKALKPADQVKFVSHFNAAIAKLPGSGADRAKKYRTANVTALVAASGNFKNVLVEIFASVPVDCLEGIANDLADKVINRKENPSVTDAQYTEIAEKCVDAIVVRTVIVESSDMRNAIAVAMFLKGADGSLPDLEHSLYVRAKISEEVAVSVALPASMSDGFILDAVAGGSLTEAILNNGFGDNAILHPGEDIDVFRVPRTTKDVPWNPERDRSENTGPNKLVPQESKEYPGQVIWVPAGSL